MLPYKNTDNLIHPDGSLSLIIETILSHRLRVPVAICHSLSGVFFDSRCTSQFGRTPTTLIHAPSPTPHLASLSHFQLHQKDPTGFSTIPVLLCRTRSLVSRHPRSYFFAMAPEPDIRRGGAGGTRVLPIMTDRTTPFFCPFCPTRKFYYLHAVHDHFTKKHCATYCPNATSTLGIATSLSTIFNSITNMSVNRLSSPEISHQVQSPKQAMQPKPRKPPRSSRLASCLHGHPKSNTPFRISYPGTTHQV